MEKEINIPKEYNHWIEIISWDLNFPSQFAIIDGKHYQFKDAKSAIPQFKGCGGRIHRIKFFAGVNAGKIIITDNLWHQGEIPKDLIKLLPEYLSNNAHLVPTNCGEIPNMN